MPEKKKRGPGRPKGTGRGPLGDRFSVKVSPEYKTWMEEFAIFMKVEMADIFREGMRTLAEKNGFQQPPLL